MTGCPIKSRATALGRVRTWFSGLKVAQKLMLISVFFIMPDSLMLYLFITGINDNIRFARQEQKGNEYQRALEDLLEVIPQHGWLAADAGTVPTDAVARKQAQIERALQGLEAVDRRIGTDLQFTDEGLAKRQRGHFRVKTLRSEWEKLKAELPGADSATVSARHQHLIADVRTMITHAGDNSNLILDPDLDSYYLMDVTLLALPQTQDRLATVLSQGRDILQRKAFSAGERKQLSVHTALLEEADLRRVVASTQTALNEDPNFYGPTESLQRNVPAPLKEYQMAAKAFIQLTTRLADSEQPNVALDEYVAAGQRARAASFKLWRVAEVELDTLLEKRVQHYQHRRTLSLLVSGCALLAAIGFVRFITVSISGPLRQQAAELRNANESLQAEIFERRRAEAELRKREAQLAVAQKIAHIGSWEWDLPSNQMVWSDEYCHILGWQPGEVAASHTATLQRIHPEDRAVFDATIKRAAEDGSPFSFEHRMVRSDATERIIHQRGEFALDPASHAVKAFGTAQDVTDRKQAEQALDRVHRQLLDTSRLAGMAEVATNVLHNVGNVLNSVNVTSACMADSLRKSKAATLSKVVTLLGEHATDLGRFLTADPKGKQIPNYLAQLADHLAREQAAALKELGHLQNNIDHIKDIVAMQQSLAKVSGVIETLQVADLVEDALRMNASSLARHNVQVIKEFQDVSAIAVEKHKALQILVNLVRNAKQSCDEAGLQNKRLTLRVTDGDDRVRVAVSDNGVGIPPENLTRIFSHGFTTRKDGHGFGLHSGALAAKELGGALLAHSDGPGHGATFTLELPIQSKTQTS